jgi:hypothetical protein
MFSEQALDAWEWARVIRHFRQLCRVWWDQRNLDCYADFTSELETAIARARIMIVCVTAGATSPDSFVRREIGFSDSEKLPYTGRRVRDVAAEALQKMKELQ